MDVLKTLEDKSFDLAIIDPPYGIGEDGEKNHSRGTLAPSKKYTPKSWDKEPPPKEFFEELFRVSKNQIIFGANHFISRIPFDSSCWIVWDKGNGANDFADCELAWSSFPSAVRRFKYRWAGFLQENMKNKEMRIHPTQKPISLYRWLLTRYAKPGDKILDTHSGSGSLACACHAEGFEILAIEKDEEYFQDSLKRLEEFKAQGLLFA